MRSILRTLPVVILGLLAAGLIGCSSEAPADNSKVVTKDKAPAGLQESEGAAGAGGGQPAKAAPAQTSTAP